jgi:hypothetical protein
MFDINTFGRTPAAHYLARRLVELDNKKLTRACTVRINAFNTNVAGIVSAVASESMDAKVAANLLRLLREEASKLELTVGVVDPDEMMFVDNLLRNVIIGHIKSALRKVAILRKIENGSKDLNTVMKKGYRVVSGLHIVDIDYYVMGYHAGYMAPDCRVNADELPPDVFYRTNPSISDIKDPTTPELLHDRSINRCTRQNKEWTKS